MKEKMEIEIWSDVMCPFCYIGKRRFAQALSQFGHTGEIDIQWKSFQLNPQLKTAPGKNLNEYLAETKGWTIEHAREMNKYVTDMAKELGLEYHIDKAIVANSFNAHRLMQFAKTKGLGDAAEEHLFRAYFTESRNIDDRQVLLDIGLAVGLDSNETEQVLNSNNFSEEVDRDVYEARQVGARGVPFFIFNRQYAVSGAQSPAVFLQALEKSFAAWHTQNI
jgi:predicted DsbA family dithiol-disulfide isomerase